MNRKHTILGLIVGFITVGLGLFLNYISGNGFGMLIVGFAMTALTVSSYIYFQLQVKKSYSNPASVKS